MITEDAMEIYEEPTSSQHSVAVFSLRGKAKDADDCSGAVVGWQPPPTNPALKRLRDNCQQSLRSLTHLDHGHSQEHAPVAPPLSRAPGDPKHPARMPRNPIYFPETQDPDVIEAKQLFKAKALGVQIQAIETARLKAAKLHRLQQKENGTSSRGSALRRRHTAEVVQPVTHSSRQNAALRGTTTDSNVSSLRRRASIASQPVEDGPVAGPSRLFDLHPLRFPTPLDDEEEDEDDGMPTSTPSPHPRPRSQKRGAFSASPSLSSSVTKSDLGQFSAFSESPTSLDHAPLARRHSVDPSTSFSVPRPESASPIERRSTTQHSSHEPELSPVVPSPAALAARPPLPPEAIPHPPAPAPVLSLPSPSPLIPPPLPAPLHSQVQAPAPSRPAPHPSQFPSPSRPYVMPSSTPGASQPPRPIRASQRGPPALGMRPLVRAGVGKYKVPRENPKAIAGFKVPFKNGVANGAGAGIGKRSQVSSRDAQSQVAVVGPPRVTISVPVAPARAPAVLEMSARRAEPVSSVDGTDAMDEVKEADSSYGDIPFDFDPEALDEAMSMYDP
ncbi:hypothetical protein C8Q78DRAFT_1082991 [Trametes maxima]|nr:hypothetical protein C8Q78DRAFT_1082991 [Trametes maxima]